MQIMEILTAYVRQNAPAGPLKASLDLKSEAAPRIDIQTVLTVLGRRTEEGKKIERNNRFRLDLRNTKLTKANFEFGDFSAANFSDSILEAADFRSTSLNGAQFLRCTLNFATFWKTQMRGTSLDFVKLKSVGGLLFLNEDNLGPVSLMGSDISGVRSPHQKFRRISTFGDSDTKLSPGGDKIRQGIMKKREDVERAAFDNDEDPEAAIRSFMQTSPFRFWSPFSSNDGATWQDKHAFLKHHDLLEWPYIEPD